MKKNNQINFLITKFIAPFIICFAGYIQIFGEISPGGGFQAGAIFASCLIGYDLSVKDLSSFVDSSLFLKIASFGVLIYLLTGLFSVFDEKNFLNYYSLNSQSLGIMTVELGVAITVSSVMIFIFLELKKC